MSTQRYLIGQLLRKGSANQSSAARWDFSIDLGIDAESRSVFYALTVPEYLETWLRPSGCRRVSFAQKPSGFRVQFFFDDLPPVTVDADSSVCRPDQIVLNWTAGSSTSIVCIRLQSCGGRTILHLRHRRFASEQESLWHGDLWTSSLERLAAFLEHPTTDGNAARARIRAISALHRQREWEAGSRQGALLDGAAAARAALTSS
ncbi:MAG TPA: SRPBCC domain-containing protein [Acidobacteriaceae bacterium]|nr:SRPBCC domain-containing protein [Acidobacteriaceae bacterium]